MKRNSKTKTKNKIKNKTKADPAFFLKTALQVAKGAGEILLAAEKKIHRLKITEKVAQGVASTADLASEKYIITHLRRHFPQHQFLAEEGSYEKGQMNEASFSQAEYCWVIDPLDGTHNFLNGLNYYAVCIGLAHQGVPFLGVIYRPSTGEYFYALEGKGAFWQAKGQKRKKLSKKTNEKLLHDCLLCTGFASEKGGLHEDEFRYFQALFRNSRGIRRMGSAALDLCLVAQGIFDGFWEKGLAPWDVTAAGVICQEAGVILSDFSGGAYHPFSSTILAARAPIQEHLLEVIKQNPRR